MKKTSGILWGIALVAIGVILALNALGITDINIFFDGWWTLFFIIPSLIGLISERDKTCSIRSNASRHAFIYEAQKNAEKSLS